MKKTTFHLSVCKDKEAVFICGKEFRAGDRADIEPDYIIKDDVLHLSIPELRSKIKIGGASHMEAVSIRICSESFSVIAIYDDPAMNRHGCCAHCSGGASIYGDWGCSCERE